MDEAKGITTHGLYGQLHTGGYILCVFYQTTFRCGAPLFGLQIVYRYVSSDELESRWKIMVKCGFIEDEDRILWIRNLCIFNSHFVVERNTFVGVLIISPLLFAMMEKEQKWQPIVV